MNRILLAITLIFVLINGLLAQRKTRELDTQKQDEQKKADDTYGKNDSWKDKMFYGGNFDIRFGNDYSILLIQPIVGYKLTEKFQVGLDPLYIYSSQTFKDYITGANFKLSVNAYGSGLFCRFLINENIFAHAEYMGLNFNTYSESTGKNISKFTNSMYVGGGYMPGGSGVYFMALYDLLYDSKSSLYRDPIVLRVGFVF